MKTRVGVFYEEAWQLDLCEKFFTEMLNNSGVTTYFKDNVSVKLESDLYRVEIAKASNSWRGKSFDIVFNYSNDLEFNNNVVIPTMYRSKFRS